MTVSIPPEVLDHILSFAQGAPPTWDESVLIDHPSLEPAHPNANATLLSASLVSKAWASSAQRALYRHAIFPSRPQERSYAAWLESDARTRHRTVSLWIRPWTQPLFGQVVDSLEGIESLEIGKAALAFDRPTWDVLRCSSLKDLKRLSIPFPEYLSRSTTPLTLLPFSLASLEYWFDSGTENRTHLLSALITSSQSTLRTFRIRDLSAEDLIPCPLPLSLVAPQIRHLILEEDHYRPTVLVDGLGGFSGLEKLELGAGDTYYQWSLSTGYFESTIETLPAPNSLRHLTFDFSNAKCLSHLEERLNHKALESLEVLELSNLSQADLVRERELSAGTSVKSAVAPVVAECKRRSIALPTEGQEQHHVPSLPPDVIALVFDCLREEVHQSPTDPMEGVSAGAVEEILSTGYSCCLVSHAFLPHGRNLLYSHLGLGGLESSARQLEVVLKTAHLAELVEVWEICFAEEYNCVEVAQLFPRIHTVVYDIRNLPQRPVGSTHIPTHLARLASPPAVLQSRLRCLRLRPGVLLSFDEVWAAISAYPNLETLSIGMTVSRDPVAATFALAHLRRLDVSWCYKSLLTALLIASPNLEILQIRYPDVESPSIECGFLPAPSSLPDMNLRTLVVHRVLLNPTEPAPAQAHISAEEYFPLFDFISSFTSITSLEILETNEGNATPERPAPLAIETCHELLRTLPNSLKSLYLAGTQIYAFGLALASLLPSAATSSDLRLSGDHEPVLLPHLESLGVSWPPAYKIPLQEWTPLLQACADRDLLISGKLTGAFKDRASQVEDLHSSWRRELDRRHRIVERTTTYLLFLSAFIFALYIYPFRDSLWPIYASHAINVLRMCIESTSAKTHDRVLSFFYGSVAEACDGPKIEELDL